MFVLAGVAVRPAPMPSSSAVTVRVDPSPLRSNIYGTAERMLLDWLNRLYEEQRNRLFAHLPDGWFNASWLSSWVSSWFGV